MDPNERDPPLIPRKVLDNFAILRDKSKADEQPNNNGMVIVLCGVIGTGKSTLANALRKYQNFVRVNQDELSSRKECEKACKEALERQQIVVIDRQNFDVQQRSHWVRIANEFRVPVVCWVLRVDIPTIQHRLSVRTDHPTIKSPEDGLGLLPEFCRLWEEPTAREGFASILNLVPVPLELLEGPDSKHYFESLVGRAIELN